MASRELDLARCRACHHVGTAIELHTLRHLSMITAGVVPAIDLGSATRNAASPIARLERLLLAACGHCDQTDRSYRNNELTQLHCLSPDEMSRDRLVELTATAALMYELVARLQNCCVIVN